MSPSDGIFRSHDFFIDANGHLRQKAKLPSFPMDRRLKMALNAAERREELRAEKLEPITYTPEPEPEAVPEPTPQPRQPLMRNPSQHDEYVSRVTELIRQGMTYAEAMDAVLEGGEA